LLGFRFAPRIRNLADTRLYSIEKPSSYATLAPLIGGAVNKKQITGHWDDILRLATSIKHGSVTASLMLRKARCLLLVRLFQQATRCCDSNGGRAPTFRRAVGLSHRAVERESQSGPEFGASRAAQAQ
jgi:hypothetical protein